MSYTGKENLNIMNLAINYNNHIFKWIDVDKYTNILDFGAGNGEYCNRVDLSKIKAIELDEEQRTQLRCESYNDLSSIKNCSLDLIYSLNVLEHIDDDLAILKELVSKLKDGGTIKILVPAKMELYSHMDKKVGHFRRYEKKELISLIENANLQLIEYTYFDILGYFASLVYKYIDNSGDINPKSLEIYDKVVFPISTFIDKITSGKLIGKNLMIIARKK